MKYLIIILILIYPVNSLAKVIETPYYLVNDSIDKEREKEVSLNTYTLKKTPVFTESYYSLGKNPAFYPYKSNDFIYTEYGPFIDYKFDLEDYEREEKVFYSFRRWKKIDKLIIEEVNGVELIEVKIKDKKYSLDKMRKSHLLEFEKTSLLDLKLELVVFNAVINQNSKLRIKTVEDDCLDFTVEILEKSLLTLTVKPLNFLAKIKVLEEETSFILPLEIDYELIKKEKKYRYREKKYRYYKLLDVFNEVVNEEKVKRYRKEIIEIYDEINLSSYLDVSKIIKTSTIPLKEINLRSDKECGDINITISYKDFSFKTKAYFTCQDSVKSKVKKYDNKRNKVLVLSKALLFLKELIIL